MKHKTIITKLLRQAVDEAYEDYADAMIDKAVEEAAEFEWKRFFPGRPSPNNVQAAVQRQYAAKDRWEDLKAAHNYIIDNLP
jgi:ribosome maturation protein Sdo1